MSKRGLYACFHSFIHWFILIMIRVSCTRLRPCLTDSAAHQSPSIQLSIYIHWMHVVQSLFFVNCSPAWIALSLIVHQNIRVIIIQSFCHKCRSVQYSPSIDRSSLAGLGTGRHPLHTNWWLLSSATVCMSIHQDDLYIVNHPQPVCLPACLHCTLLIIENPMWSTLGMAWQTPINWWWWWRGNSFIALPSPPTPPTPHHSPSRFSPPRCD